VGQEEKERSVPCFPISHTRGSLNDVEIDCPLAKSLFKEHKTHRQQSLDNFANTSQAKGAHGKGKL
jgi:hypothetical protein